LPFEPTDSEPDRGSPRGAHALALYKAESMPQKQHTVFKAFSSRVCTGGLPSVN
jgi:hypothetical protein